MHYLVKLIVKGENKQVAVERAETDAEQLVEEGQFDWFQMEGRWGNSKAYRVSGKKGKELIKEGMDAFREDFDSALRHIRYMMDNFSDDEIYNDQMKVDRDSLPDGVFYPSKYQFHVAGGGSTSACVYAVDGNIWGGKVENNHSLKDILKENKDLWVVPVDFHN